MTDSTDSNERRIREQAEELRRIGTDLKESMSRAARTFETLGDELRAPSGKEAESKVKPPPPKRKVLLLTDCMSDDNLKEACKGKGFEPCIYVTAKDIDSNHDLIPDIEETLKRINYWLGRFPDAKYLCLDWENPLHRMLKAEWWGVEAAMFQFRQLRDCIYRELPQLLVTEWGLPTLPWWVYYHGRVYAINKLPEPALQQVLGEAAKCQYIWDYCESLCPGIYTRHRSSEPDTVNQWKFLVAKKLELCRDFGRGKPIYPCLCPFDQHHYNGDPEDNYGLTAADLLDREEWKDVLKYVASFKPAGVTLWCVQKWWEMEKVPDNALDDCLDLMQEILLR